MADNNHQRSENCHPIRELIDRLLRDGPNDTVTLDAGALKIIERQVHSLIGQQQLMDCVEMVLAVANLVQFKYKSVATAQALVDLVNAPVVVDGLREINLNKGERTAETKRRVVEGFARLGATETKKSAPRIDQAVPQGALKLGDLHRPKRLM